MLTGSNSHESYGLITVSVIVGGAIFVLLNVLLVCGAIALSSGGSVLEAFRDHLRYSGPTFAIAVFVAAQAVILWRLSAPLVLLLGAPFFALTLYQRSSVRGRVAEEVAATDGLTGLRNRRAFEHDFAHLLESEEDPGSAALCLIDIDRFKQVNDRHGHMTGDAVLDRLAHAIEDVAPGLGYRIGGDEFALLLEPAGHMDVIGAVQERFGADQEQLRDLTERVTISAGVAFFPEQADDLHSLQKRADMALYRSKYNGRARVSVYGAEELGEGPASLDDPRLPPDRRSPAHRAPPRRARRRGRRGVCARARLAHAGEARRRPRPQRSRSPAPIRRRSPLLPWHSRGGSASRARSSSTSVWRRSCTTSGRSSFPTMCSASLLR